MSVYSTGETHPGLADTKIPGVGSPTSNRGIHNATGGRRASQSQLNRTYSQASLHRSVSQLLDIYDKKSFVDELPWDTIIRNHRAGSRGLYVDEEDLVNVIKGFSTVTKEHTTFTDTHL
ncbi:UNVERIFIED_CONTAM: hypothetical protein H355_015210 [Colinus virginianus]|nr:hypothetical protein H355_015210 [Colinus virginianus]